MSTVAVGVTSVLLTVMIIVVSFLIVRKIRAQRFLGYLFEEKRAEEADRKERKP